MNDSQKPPECKSDFDAENDGGYTYVAGQGFVNSRQQPGGNAAGADDLRRMSNLLCLILLLYFFFQRIFKLPLIYLGHLIGFNIRINPLTGMIVKTAASEVVISFLTNVVSMLVVVLLVLALYRQPVHNAHLFRRPNRGVTSLAIPMILSGGMVGMLTALLFYQVMRVFGVVLYETPTAVYHINPEMVLGLITAVLFAAFQEILFRGVLLAPLRQFGDGFAIIASGMLYALWTNGMVEAISAFLFGVCAAFFVIRSGSVLTAIYARCCMIVLLFGSRVLNGMVEQSLAQVILMVVSLGIAVLAVLAYVRYIKLDNNAFRLVKPEGTMSTHARLGAFCGAIGFILLLVAIFLRTVGIVQIIG